MAYEYEVKSNGKKLKYAGMGPKEVIQIARDKARVAKKKKQDEQKKKDSNMAKEMLELERIKREMKLKRLIEGIK